VVVEHQVNLRTMGSSRPWTGSQPSSSGPALIRAPKRAVPSRRAISPSLAKVT
jgi:hypothetical protein